MNESRDELLRSGSPERPRSLGRFRVPTEPSVRTSSWRFLQEEEFEEEEEEEEEEKEEALRTKPRPRFRRDSPNGVPDSKD